MRLTGHKEVRMRTIRRKYRFFRLRQDFQCFSKIVQGGARTHMEAGIH
jgi:hypothetical protein